MRFLSLLLLVCLAAAAAQHSGTVKAGEQPIPGAVVTAVHGDRRLVTSTDEGGLYTLDLSPGEWTVRVEMFGFQVTEKSVLQTDAPSAENWALVFAKPSTATPPKPAEGFQAVRLTQVAGEPPDLPNEPISHTAAVEETSTESFLVSGSLSQGLQAPKEEDMGYIARAFAAESAAAGSPEGATPPGFGGSAGEREGAGMRGARPGMRRSGQGGPAMGPGGPMAGGAGGGGRVPAFLAKLSPEQRSKLMDRMKKMRSRGDLARSFGNRRKRGPGIRGAFTFTAGNSAFDARPYSLTGFEYDKPDYAQNRIHVMLGGPLRIPKLVDLSRTFFTLNFSTNINRNPYNAFGTVPTELERSGDFSQTAVHGPVRIFDPQSGAPFAGNRIPPSRMTPAAAGLLRYLPLPNRPGNVQNYQIVRSTSRDTREFGFRINQSLSTKNRISGGLSFQSRDTESPHLLGFIDEGSGKGYTVDIGWTFTLGPRRIHDLRFRINRDRNETLPFFAFRDNVAGELGIRGPSDNPLNWGPPNLNFTNFADLTDGNPLLRRNQNVSIIDSVNMVYKGHTVGSGIEFRWAQINTNTDQNARGSFTFSGLMTSGLDAQGQPLPGTGLDFADFLLGFPQSSSIRYGSTNTYFRSRVYAAWLQDEWRVKSNLTLNLGVRYEYYSPFYEKFGRLANLDVAPGFTGVAVVTPEVPGPYTGAFPRALVEPDKNNLAPRIGFAWRPIPKSRFQIRGGYSQFYDGSAYANIATRLAGQPPFATTGNISTSTQRRLTIENGFVLPGESGKKVTNTFAVARTYLVPYAQTWNFAVQHEFGQSIVVETGYLGTKGTRLDVLRSPNRAAPGSPLTAEQRRAIGNAVGFTYDSSEGNSIYHALQVRVARRLKKGISASALYTFSKSIDNASSIGGAGNVVAQNDKDLHAERGLSIFDQRHNLTLTEVVNSPFGETAFWLRDRSMLSKFLRNWNLSTSLTARSGRPFSARVLGNISDAGGTGAVGSGRADATGQSVTGGFGLFNTAAFAIPPAGRFGNAGRNTIPGPGFIGLNVSFGRTFDLSDRRKIEFRIASDNATNNVNYTSIGTVVNANNYGLPIGAGQMRTVSTTVRFRF